LSVEIGKTEIGFNLLSAPFEIMFFEENEAKESFDAFGFA
jgi:hypothetical protein